MFMKNNDSITDVALFEKNEEEVLVVYFLKTVKVYQFVKGKNGDMDITYHLLTENACMFSRLFNLQ
jgi:hypothetical protein